MLPTGSLTFPAGNYQFHYDLFNQYGCDSSLDINLVVQESFHTQIFDTICQGNTYQLPNGIITASAGVYNYKFSTQHGCDSLVTVNLEVNDTAWTYLNPVICGNETYQLPNGQWVNSTGIHTFNFNTVNGCDSTVIVDLIVNPYYDQQQSVSVCAGSPAVLPTGQFVYAAGVYVDTLHTNRGCDSIITTTVNVRGVDRTTIDTSVCFGFGIQVGPNYYSQGGYFVDTLTNSAGCDSIIDLVLNVLPRAISQVDTFICPGDTIFIGEMAFWAQGNCQINYSGRLGCDSIVNLSLYYHNLPSIDAGPDQEVVAGDSININLTASGLNPLFTG
jgi:hypothetical protein